MTANAIVASHKPIRIYVAVSTLGVMLQYRVPASLSYFFVVGKEQTANPVHIKSAKQPAIWAPTFRISCSPACCHIVKIEGLS